MLGIGGLDLHPKTDFVGTRKESQWKLRYTRTKESSPSSALLLAEITLSLYTKSWGFAAGYIEEDAPAGENRTSWFGLLGHHCREFCHQNTRQNKATASPIQDERIHKVTNS